MKVEPVEGRQSGEGGQGHLGERVVAQVEGLERGRKVNSEIWSVDRMKCISMYLDLKL